MLNFGLFCHSNFACARFHGTEPFARTLSGSAVALAPQSPSLGHLSCICSAVAYARPLKCHALKRCTFWRETCLASAFALRLVNQRARAANQRARAAKLGNKSRRSVLPFKLRLDSFSWNRTILRLVPSQIQSWGTKAEGLFCHSNFVCTRFHGTEPFYHKIIFHTNF